MSLFRLITRELMHRKINALLMAVSVIAAVACLVTSLCLLKGHDLQTDAIVSELEAETQRIVDEKEKETQQRVEQLKDDYRKIVLKLGFNVYVIHKDVRPDQAHEAGLGGKDLPESYVHKLANAGILTIDHLLPSLSAGVLWPERKRQVILTGVRGEVAVAGKKRKRPLIQPVKPGEIVLGYKLAKDTGLKKGDSAVLLGKTLTVAKTHEARGTQDDNTAWVDLPLAQELLGKEGRITAIQAINCLAPHCHPDATGIPSVNQEISGVLPDTQVIIDMGKARARIEARHRAAAEAEAALKQATEQREAHLAQVTKSRGEMRQQIDQLASVMNPLVVLGASLWVGLLALGNVRERRAEIGVLRALGVNSTGVLTIFLGKALLIGVVGALLGVLLGTGLGISFAGSVGGATELIAATPRSAPDTASATRQALLAPTTVVLLLAAAPLLAVLASWVPALIAAQQDPADVLAEE